MKKMRLILLCLSFLLTALAVAGVPKGYYKNLKDLSGAQLKDSLRKQIYPNKTLTYGSGDNSTWSGFYQTDSFLGEDNKLQFYFAESASELSCSAVSGMNIEHSFPKSWWGGSTNTAYKDLYNLMPCESKINNSKQNYAMGKVTSPNSSKSNGCTTIGTGPNSKGTSVSLWEPADEWKGDFARGYFYMVTAYADLTWQSNGLDMLENEEDEDHWPTLQQWAYELLLQWCRQDPVDQIEIDRNEAVYNIQGNRNPFVDFPNLAEYIWGDSIDCGFPGGDGSNPYEEDEYILLNESFMAGLGVFSSVYRDGSSSNMWESSSSYGAVANAYSKGKSADDYLLSPPLDLRNLKDIRLTFDHAAGYHGTNDASKMFEVLVSTDYAGVPQSAHWDVLDVAYPGAPKSGNFTNYLTVKDFDLSAYSGETIRLAFRYRATSSQCWAWELRRLTLKATEDTTGILEPDFAEADRGPDAVYTLDGIYVGTELPSFRGLYIVRQNGRTVKMFVR